MYSSREVHNLYWTYECVFVSLTDCCIEAQCTEILHLEKLGVLLWHILDRAQSSSSQHTATPSGN